MTALKKPELVTVEEYLAGEERSDIRHEYLGGVIHAMSGGTNDHAAIAANGILSLGAQLRGKPCRPFGSDAKVRIEYPDHTRFYYPDLQVVCQLNSGAPYWATSANFSSASDATSLPTMQRQRVEPIEPRIFSTSASMCRVSPGSTGRRHFTLSALMK